MSLKVKVLGTGGAVNDGRLYTSLLVDDKILIDPSPTSIWALKQLEVKLEGITHIFITHYHGDHFFGLPLILLDMYVKGAPEELYILGPYNVEARVRDILELAFPGLSEDMVSKLKPNFHSLTMKGLSGKEIGGVKFWAFPGEHAIESYSVVVEHKGKRVGYSGDTLLTDGVREVVKLSHIAFLDMNDLQSRVGKHMNKEDILTIRKEYPQANIWIIHTKFPVEPFDGLNVASDLQVIEL